MVLDRRKFCSFPVAVGVASVLQAQTAWAENPSDGANSFMESRAADLVAGGLARLPVRPFPDAGSLDYTSESLRRIDDYLVKFREPLPKDEKGHLALRSLPFRNEESLSLFVYMIGGYTGEVMRRTWKRKLTWITFADLLRADTRHKGWLGDRPSIETAYILTNCNHGFVSLPLNKVIKFLVNGSEDSLHSFALAGGGRQIGEDCPVPGK